MSPPLVEAPEAPASLCTARPRRHPYLVAHSVLDEMVLYDPLRRMAYSMNVSARAVWEHCDGALTVAEIGHALAGAIGTDEAVLLPDVEEAVRTLQELGLVDLLPDPHDA